MKKSLVLIFGLCFSASLMANTLDPAFASFNKDKFSGDVMAPNKEPIKGLKVLEIYNKDQAERNKLLKDYFSGNYVVIDTRSKTLNEQCHIKNSANLEYKFAGEKGNELTKEKLTKLLAEKGKDKDVPTKKGVVFYCNDAKCYRSTNAAIEAVLNWGIAVEKVIWLRGGVPEIAAVNLSAVEGDSAVCAKYAGDFVKNNK